MNKKEITASQLIDEKSSQGEVNNDNEANEELDPINALGYRTVLEKEIPIECRLSEPSVENNQVGTLESIKVRILYANDENKGEKIKIEMTSEIDLFFNYTVDLDEEKFVLMKQEQKLNMNFDAFSNALSKLLNQCLRDPTTYFVLFLMQRDGNAKLQIVQNFGYKFSEILNIDFFASSEEVIRQNITYRYNSLKARFTQTSQRLTEVIAFLKLKNPTLLNSLGKVNQTAGQSQMSKSMMVSKSGGVPFK